MKKMSFAELCGVIERHNRIGGIKSQYSDLEPLECVIVFKGDSWPGKEYPLESRSYRFRSDEKYFLPEMGGSGLFATSLDRSDSNVRLDLYFPQWKIDYCYIIERRKEI